MTPLGPEYDAMVDLFIACEELPNVRWVAQKTAVVVAAFVASRNVQRHGGGPTIARWIVQAVGEARQRALAQRPIAPSRVESQPRLRAVR